MQNVWNRINTVLLVLVLVLVAGAVAKQVYGGPMDPPGPPGSTLPQVEPRMPIPPVGWNGSFPIVISQQGSYFLTQDIFGEAGKDGIQITVNNVTLDLNGFMVWGGSGSLNGVHATCSGTCHQLAIHSGYVSGWGGAGIDAGLSDRFEITGVRANGNSGDGIAGGANTTITDCQVMGNGGDGVDAGSSWVIVKNSQVVANGGNGIVAGGSIVEGNVVQGNSGDGISVSGGTITGNESDGNGQDGILVRVGGCRMIDNAAGSNQGKGIEVVPPAPGDPGCMIWRNSAGDNAGGNYAVAGAGDIGPIGTANASTSPWANISD